MWIRPIRLPYPDFSDVITILGMSTRRCLSLANDDYEIEFDDHAVSWSHRRLPGFSVARTHEDCRT